MVEVRLACYLIEIFCVLLAGTYRITIVEDLSKSQWSPRTRNRKTTSYYLTHSRGGIGIEPLTNSEVREYRQMAAFGRPRKQPSSIQEPGVSESTSTLKNITGNSKDRAAEVTAINEKAPTESVEEVPQKRPRGRPRKVKPSVVPEEDGGKFFPKKELTTEKKKADVTQSDGKMNGVDKPVVTANAPLKPFSVDDLKQEEAGIEETSTAMMEQEVTPAPVGIEAIEDDQSEQTEEESCRDDVEATQEVIANEFKSEDVEGPIITEEDIVSISVDDAAEPKSIAPSIEDEGTTGDAIITGEGIKAIQEDETPTYHDEHSDDDRDLSVMMGDVTDYTISCEEGNSSDEEETTGEDSQKTGATTDDDNIRPKTFVEKLEYQLKSRKTRLPESFYAEDVHSIVDNSKLPEGCKTLMDFFNLPKNLDFKNMVDLAIHGTDTVDGLNAYGSEASSTVDNPVYTGKYPDSLFDYIFKPVMHERRYSTSKGEPNAVDLVTVYDHLKGKKVDELMPQQAKSPVERIHERYFIFDTYHYMRHYLTHLNRYNYDVLSSHHKDDSTMNYYLNNEYTQHIPKRFPPVPDHTSMIREYFIGIIPEIMDILVNLIKDDPNKKRIPSPPLHDMSLAPGFKLPDYMRSDYQSDDTRTGGYNEDDFVKYSSLEGLHDPSKHLYYPYADVEPLYQRQLLSTYLDMVKTGDLGEPATYKKFKSMTADIKNEMFPDQTKLPQEIYGDKTREEKSVNQRKGPVTLVKVYERGTRKCSVALVYLEPGNGNIIINNRDGYQYVRYCTHRLRDILEPLDAIYAYKKFNIVAVVHGGGISGQAGAIRHALARYIIKVLSPKLEPYLSLRGLTKADTRQVERKKTNLRKARKKEHYSKR